MHQLEWLSNMRRLIRNPQTGVLTPVDDGQSSRDTQALNYNNWAYSQAMQKRQEMLAQAQSDQNLADTKNQSQQAYHALAGALGMDVTPQKDVWDEQTQRYVRPKSKAPTFDQLKGKFTSLPEDQQAKIYAQGGAQFLDPETGSALLESVRKAHDAAINKGIDSMVQQVTEGKVQYNPQDRKFYRSIDDPNDPLGKKKLQVPITLLEAKYIKEGMDRGMMFDIDQFGGKAGTASPGNGAVPPSGPVPPNGLERPLHPDSSPVLSTDAPTRLGQQVRAAFTGDANAPSLLDRIKDFGQTAPADLANTLSKGVNAVVDPLNAVQRFGGAALGTPVSQMPNAPYIPVQSDLLAAPARRNATLTPLNNAAGVASALASANSVPKFLTDNAPSTILPIEPPLGFAPSVPTDPLNDLQSNIARKIPIGPDQSAMMNWLNQKRLGADKEDY